MTTTTTLHNLAFALVRDAATLMDAIDPGTTVLAAHDYGPVTIRARRAYTPERDALTLIAYHDDELVATVIASNNGYRVSARIHQFAVSGVLFKRHGDWGFVGIGRIEGRRRRIVLTASPHTAGASRSAAKRPPCGPASTSQPATSPPSRARPTRGTAGRPGRPVSASSGPPEHLHWRTVRRVSIAHRWWAACRHSPTAYQQAPTV